MDLSKIENFQDAIVTVMGLGRYTQGSGLGATKWLMRHGAQTVITDLKTDVELKESVDLVMEWYNKYREQFRIALFISRCLFWDNIASRTS